MKQHNGIQDSLSVMRTALRVLVRHTYGRSPRPDDLDKLRVYAPDIAHFAVDDLAREVIQRVQRGRAKARSRGAD